MALGGRYNSLSSKEHCEMNTAHYILHTAHCTLPTFLVKLNTIHYKLLTEHNIDNEKITQTFENLTLHKEF